ncbi:MAG: TolC family protein [Cyclobacteriaceae bacterium]
MNIRIPSVIMSMLLLLGSFSAQGQDTLRLAEAVQVGLENNFNIRIARNNVGIAENNHSLGNAGFLPTVDVLASRDFDIQDSELNFASGDNQIVNGARSNNFTASGLLSWTIFDGTRMFVTYERLAEIRQASELDAQVVLENLISDISAAYYTVILEQARAGVLQNAVELSNERRKLARNLYEIGKASKLEYLAAQVDYNADTSALIQQKGRLYNASVNLNTLMARPPETEVTVPEQIDANLELDLEDLRENTLAGNPNLLLARRNQRIAYLQMKELQAEILPEVNLNLGYNYATSEAQAGFVLGRRSNGVAYGISANMTLFDGFNRIRQSQNARVLIENSELQIENLRLQLQADLQSTFVDYTNSIRLLELESNNLEIARENAAIALERYRLGRSTALELREAQINAVQAESRLIDAIYTTKIAEIELLRLSGQIMQPA